MKTKAQLKKVLFFNWKDIKHPQAGGAEIITHQLAKRLVIDGHTVTLITAKYNNSLDREYIDGVEVIRVGKNRFFHYSAARKYYLKNLKNQYDVIIEEVNTIPYFINLIKGNEKVFLFYHQLAGPVWFKEMFQPLSTFGFLLEPIYTYIQAKFSDQTITVSNSSKEDLVRHGFDSAKIHIISEGLENKPLRNISESLPKEKIFTILFHSSLRAMKRPMEVLKVFSIFSKKYPDSQLWISGGGNQKMLKKYATQNGFINQVKFFGRTTDKQKFELMQKAHVLCATSIKEGWGLIVSEVNSQGTPAISYDVDGLRDSTTVGGGVITKPNPQAMSQALEVLYNLVNNQPKVYINLQTQALESTKNITYQQSYKDLKKILDK